MTKNFYKKTTAVFAITGLFLLYQNCSHVKKSDKSTAYTHTFKSPKSLPTKTVVNEPIKPEKIFLTTEETLKIFWNRLDLPETFHSPAVVDLNSDKHLDVIYNNSDQKQLEIYTQNDNKEFKLFNSLATTGPVFSQVLTLDLNSDGRVDIVTASTGGIVNVWLQNSTDKYFYERLDFKTSLGSTGPTNFISSGDVNNDGHIDIAVANTQNRLGGFVTLLLNDGEGILSLRQIMIGEGLAPYHVSLTDFDQDGYSDLIFTSKKSNHLYVYKNINGKLTEHFKTPTTLEENLDLHSLALEKLQETEPTTL